MKSLKSKLLNLLPDKVYLKYKFKKYMGYSLNLKHPRTYNEKLQWLKLNDRNPEYTKLVDKYEVKKYIASIIGAEYVIPTIGIWNSFDEIDFDSLPNKFVLKTTHDSGGVVVCNDKKHFDIELARNKLCSSLNNRYFYMGREWPYKNVKPRIIAEQYMEDSVYASISSCFKGLPRMTIVCSEYVTEHGIQEFYYDEALSLLCLDKNQTDGLSFTESRSNQYNIIKRINDKLLNNSRLERIDYYEIDSNTLFVDCSFASDHDFDLFFRDKTNVCLGEWKKLSSGVFLLNCGNSKIYFGNCCSNSELRVPADYKIFCFNGEIDSIMVCTGREKGHPDFYFYDTNWKRLYYQHENLEKNDNIAKPNNLNDMIKIAKLLSKDFYHIRVDLYLIGNNVYFSELTFFDNSGFDTDITYDTDMMWGKKLRLPLI